MSEWLRDAVGVDPSNLHPSVRFGLEGALLTAFAEQRGESLACGLGSSCGGSAMAQHGHGTPGGSLVQVNGLLDCSGGPQAAAAEAAELVRRGYRALKIKVRPSRSGLPATLSKCVGAGPSKTHASASKYCSLISCLMSQVGRGADALVDARAVLAVRAAVGQDVALRADANRR